MDRRSGGAALVVALGLGARLVVLSILLGLAADLILARILNKAQNQRPPVNRLRGPVIQGKLVDALLWGGTYGQLEPLVLRHGNRTGTIATPADHRRRGCCHHDYARRCFWKTPPWACRWSLFLAHHCRYLLICSALPLAVVAANRAMNTIACPPWL